MCAGERRDRLGERAPDRTLAAAVDAAGREHNVRRLAQPERFEDDRLWLKKLVCRGGMEEVGMEEVGMEELGMEELGMEEVGM